MALSTKARKRLEVAMCHRADAKEVADAIDAAGNADLVLADKAAAVADIATADATTLETAEALANANKAKINALLAALRTAGILTE